jgi:predicted dehydrogenase
MTKMNRRNFIGKTAAGAVAVTVIPRHVLGGNGFVAANDRVNLGYIGNGKQIYTLLDGIGGCKETVAVAACDVFKKKLDAFVIAAKKNNSAKNSTANVDSYHFYRELLERKDIDAVVVATPDHWHAQIVVDAAKAGKDIYCEKPLVNSIPEGRAVCDAVKRYKRVLQTGSHERSGSSVRFACELVRNGRIGKLHTIRINMPVDNQIAIGPQSPMPVPPGLDYNLWLGPTTWYPYTRRRGHFYWRYILEYGGGEMTDRGAHIIDLAQLGNNSDDSGPVKISARGSAPRNGLFDTYDKYTFECEYVNGVRMLGSTDQPRGLKFEGTEGWLFVHIHGGRLEAQPASLLQEIIGPEEIHLGRSPGHHRNFLDCIKTRNLPMASAEVGHRTATICHLINIALQTERPLHWDPVKERVVNDEGMDRMAMRPMRSPWYI